MVIPAVLICAVQPRALITKLTGDLGVDEQAFVTEATLREELALFFRMDILALGICLIALRPMLASYL